MELVLSSQFEELAVQETYDIDAMGWLAWTFAAVGGAAASVAGAIAGAAAGMSLNKSVRIPYIGTITATMVGALAGAAAAYSAGATSAYTFGRQIEQKLGWG